MGSLGLPELLVILVIVVLIFGANRCRSLASGVGQRDQELQGRHERRHASDDHKS